MSTVFHVRTVLICKIPIQLYLAQVYCVARTNTKRLSCNAMSAFTRLPFKKCSTSCLFRVSRPTLTPIWLALCATSSSFVLASNMTFSFGMSARTSSTNATRWTLSKSCARAVNTTMCGIQRSQMRRNSIKSQWL